jgi:hypothetical protein
VESPGDLHLLKPAPGVHGDRVPLHPDER